MSVFGSSVHRKAFLRDAVQRLAGAPGLAIAGALLHPGTFLRRACKNGLLIARAWVLFKTPGSLIRHYFTQTAPSEKRIHFRNGKELILSGHRLDIVVLFQVFCEKVYPTDPDTVVLDIGGNIGLFAVYAALSGARKVYAFEPNREAYRHMLENISRNGLQTVIVPHNYAVTSKSDEVVAIPKGASPQNRITYGPASNDEYESVHTICVDDIVEQEGISCVHLLKMDCEGSEYDILAGMSDATFSKIRRIIVEYHDDEAGQIYEDLKQHGFKLEKHVPETDRMGMLWFRKS
jgi:FkbM family methyltransferase